MITAFTALIAKNKARAPAPIQQPDYTAHVMELVERPGAGGLRNFLKEAPQRLRVQLISEAVYAKAQGKPEHIAALNDYNPLLQRALTNHEIQALIVDPSQFASLERYISNLSIQKRTQMFSYQDPQIGSWLHHAAMANNTRMISLMLNCGFDPNSLNRQHLTAYSLARTNGHQAAADRLIFDIAKKDVSIRQKASPHLEAAFPANFGVKKKEIADLCLSYYSLQDETGSQFAAESVSIDETLERIKGLKI